MELTESVSSSGTEWLTIDIPIDTNTVKNVTLDRWQACYISSRSRICYKLRSQSLGSGWCRYACSRCVSLNGIKSDRS